MFEHGWYLLAFVKELDKPVNLLRFGTKRLLGIVRDGKVSVHDDACPHRGASLSQGGTIADDAVRCPFHGLKIGLGSRSGDGLCAREYKSLVRGGMLFVRLSDRELPDVTPTLETLGEAHEILPGFSLEMKTPIEVVSENGWDPAHFRAVHHIQQQPKFDGMDGPGGELITEGVFTIKRSGWYESMGFGELKTRFRARAFSPGLVIADLSGQPPYNYSVITGCVPGLDPRTCTIRIGLALPRSAAKMEKFVENLMVMSRRGLEEDRIMWENLDLNTPSDLVTAADHHFVAFWKFCHRFGVPTDRRLSHLSPEEIDRLSVPRATLA